MFPRQGEHPVVVYTGEASKKVRGFQKKNNKKKDKKSSYLEGWWPMIKRETASAEDVENFPWLDRNAVVLRSPRTRSLVNLNAFPPPWQLRQRRHLSRSFLMWLTCRRPPRQISWPVDTRSLLPWQLLRDGALEDWNLFRYMKSLQEVKHNEEKEIATKKCTPRQTNTLY